MGWRPAASGPRCKTIRRPTRVASSVPETRGAASRSAIVPKQAMHPWPLLRSRSSYSRRGWRRPRLPRVSLMRRRGAGARRRHALCRRRQFRRPADRRLRAARCLLAHPAGAALAEVARDFAPRGLGLKVFDCYRPAARGGAFPALGARPQRHGQSGILSPYRQARRCSATAISPRAQVIPAARPSISRSRGPRPRARHGHAVRFLQPRIFAFGPERRAHSAKPCALLAAAMRRGGFRPYAKEWWHYTLADEPFPDTYFDFPVR